MLDSTLFNNVIKKGLENIENSDNESQRNFIKIICEDVRNMDEKVIHRAKAFYVPNDQYMCTMFGDVIKNEMFDCYYFDNSCKWLNNLVFPIKNLAGVIVGLAGFNPHIYLNTKETGDKSLNYYSYSNKKVFNKGNYLYCMEGCYKKALDQGYLILTDGLFDCLSLESYGYNAAALLGSTVKDQILSQLIFIDKIILAHDNDLAGLKLANYLSKKLPNLVCVKQKYTKDVDDVLKTSHRDNFLVMLDNLINKKGISMKTIYFKC